MRKLGDMPFDYSIAARAMQAASRIPRERFVAKADRLPPPSRSTLVPFVGWIGPSYNGGTVVIGKDPGGAIKPHEPGQARRQRRAPKRDQALDSHLEDQLLALPAAEDAEAAMRSISHSFLMQMPYNGMQHILGQISSKLDESIESMAFFNLCPYRTAGPSFIRGLREVAVHLVPALSAHTVLILNSPVANDLPKVGDGTLGAGWPPVIVYRRRKDEDGLHDVGLQALEALSRDPEWRQQRGRAPL